MALRSPAQPVRRPQVGRPRRLILDHHEALQRIQVFAVPCRRSTDSSGPPASAARVVAAACVATLRARLTKKPLHSRGVPPDLADLVYVDPTELTDDSRRSTRWRFRDGELAQRGPASDSDARRQAPARRDSHAAPPPAPHRQAGLPVRSRPIAAAKLEEAHRAHPQAGEPAGPRVPGDIVCRHGRAREDELAWLATVVDGSPHMVPDRRVELPLVDQPGRLSVEHRGRVHVDRIAHVVIDVQQCLAGGYVTPAHGLAATACPLDQHSAGCLEQGRQLLIDNSGRVRHL